MNITALILSFIQRLLGERWCVWLNFDIDLMGKPIGRLLPIENLHDCFFKRGV